MTHPEDIVIWPCGEWCYAEELGEYLHKSDDYRRIPVDTPEYAALDLDNPGATCHDK